MGLKNHARIFAGHPAKSSPVVRLGCPPGHTAGVRRAAEPAARSGAPRTKEVGVQHPSGNTRRSAMKLADSCTPSTEQVSCQGAPAAQPVRLLR